jgi:hypothetical protein
VGNFREGSGTIGNHENFVNHDVNAGSRATGSIVRFTFSEGYHRDDGAEVSARKRNDSSPESSRATRLETGPKLIDADTQLEHENRKRVNHIPWNHLPPISPRVAVAGLSRQARKPMLRRAWHRFPNLLVFRADWLRNVARWRQTSRLLRRGACCQIDTDFQRTGPVLFHNFSNLMNLKITSSQVHKFGKPRGKRSKMADCEDRAPSN